ncbi:Cytochrome P450 306a1 [Blattella germanica]|nr:Cytochrome P450 306a1 [Blattella germanica]
MDDSNWTVLVLLVLSVCSLLLLIWFERRRSSRLPPGPLGLPILGFLPWIDPKTPHLTLSRLARRYGPIYSLRMGRVFTVVLSDQRLIRQAFAKDAFSGRAPLYLTHGIMKGYGLICAQGELWKDQRKFVSTFLKNFGMVKFGSKRERLEKKLAVFVKECLDKLDKQVLKEEPLDAVPLLLHCLGNVMNSLVFGVVYDENDPTWKWLQHIQEEGIKQIGVAGPINFLPILRHIPRFKKVMNSLIDGKDKTHELYREIIENHLQKQKCADVDDDLVFAFLEERDRRGKDGEDFYSTLQFHHLLADMFGAGVDTTLTTLRWFILYMAAYPDVQKRVQDEMDSVLGTRAPSLEDAPLLPYTEAAIAETQRIRSTVPLGIPHGSLEDTVLAGFHIPKGTMVVPLQWAVHMDPEHWPEPECFRPERFLKDDGGFNKPEAFIPFQTGKRMCVGEELARMLLFLFGASIVHRFFVSPPDGVKVDLEGICGITLIPKTQKLVYKHRF